MEDDRVMAKLNEVSDYLRVLTAGRVREIINPAGGAIAQAGCTGDCGCRGGYCGCNAGVSSAERFDLVTLPEYMEMRQARLQELQAAIKRLEVNDG